MTETQKSVCKKFRENKDIDWTNVIFKDETTFRVGKKHIHKCQIFQTKLQLEIQNKCSDNILA